MGNKILEGLVDNVDVGQRGIRVLARKGKVLKIGAALEQNRLRILVSRRGRGLIEIVEQIDQVRSGAQNRFAIFAATVIERSKEALERGIGDDRISRSRRR